MNKIHSRDRSRGSAAYLGMAAALLVASGGLLGGYFYENGASARPSRAEPAAVKPASEARAPRGVNVETLDAALQELLEAKVTVRIGQESVLASFGALGIIKDASAMQAAADAAHTGDVLGSLKASGTLPLTVDRERAIAELTRLKTAHDRPPLNARMDLEERVIHKSRDGVSLDMYGSLTALELAARSGVGEVELNTVSLPAEVTVETLGIEDISHVLASFETKYSVSDWERNFNLKLAASKLNGYVLKPGQEFSFNDVVGARTEKEGYKVAGVIEAGEMVDGLAGGTCQISTTLHGAAFFAGLGIDKALPHSRPSTYVTMGLDATVVYPSVDLKLRNDYDFPIVIHYKVTEGKAEVEILGRERPYDKVVFERDVVEKLEFDTVTREDDSMPVGTMMVDQYGFYGYKVDKIRKFYKGDKVVKRDKWTIRYAPVTEYVRMGINPDPNLTPPKPDNKKHKKKRLKEPDEGTFKMAR